jgi:ABC-type Na+ efflux pump permease subunit
MLDNLRDQPETAIFHEEEGEGTPETLEAPVVSKQKKKQKPEKVHRRRSFDQIIGMNAFQRFVLAVMFFITLCLLGFVFLILMGKIVPTFLY